MKETRIEAPNGCEIKKVEIIDGVAVVTFKEKERKLPKSWKEFCEMFPIKGYETFITSGSYVHKAVGCKRDNISDKNLLPDHVTANAVLALCQLIQLRNCYNGDWMPDWNDNKKIYFIIFDCFQNIRGEDYSATPRSLLYFKTKEMRDEFLHNFRQLIEKLEPIYGIL